MLKSNGVLAILMLSVVAACSSTTETNHPYEYDSGRRDTSTADASSVDSAFDGNKDAAATDTLSDADSSIEAEQTLPDAVAMDEIDSSAIDDASPDDSGEVEDVTVTASDDVFDSGSGGSQQHDATTDATVVDAKPDVIDAGLDGYSPDAAPIDSKPPACVPSNCGTNSWACWHMPNAQGSGLPNETRYTDLGDGTIRDEVTCLVWEKNITSSSTAYTFDEFEQRCQSPSYSGSGWRRPTRIELISTVNYATKSPATTVFPNAPYDVFWTGTSSAADTTRGWSIRFYDGLIATKPKTGHYYGRCVRGNASTSSTGTNPPDQYSIGLSEVTDKYTGLTWQRDESNATVSIDVATAQCTALGTGWRLPSLNELATLVDDARTTPPAVTIAAFPTTHGDAATDGWYWSNSVNDDGRWLLNFKDGTVGQGTIAAYAKCVK